MALQFRCPCGASLRSSESIAGKKITCPKCGRQLQIKPAPAETPQENSPLDPLDWNSQANTFPSAPSNRSKWSISPAKKSVGIPMGLWIAAGVGSLALVAGISAVLVMSRQPSMSTAFRPSEVTSPNTTNAMSSSSNSNTGNGTTQSIELISGMAGSEITNATSPTLKLAEEFANHVWQGSSYGAFGMIADEDFDKRFKDGPSAGVWLCRPTRSYWPQRPRWPQRSRYPTAWT